MTLSANTMDAMEMDIDAAPAAAPASRLHDTDDRLDTLHAQEYNSYLCAAAGHAKPRAAALSLFYTDGGCVSCACSNERIALEIEGLYHEALGPLLAHDHPPQWAATSRSFFPASTAFSVEASGSEHRWGLAASLQQPAPAPLSPSRGNYTSVPTHASSNGRKRGDMEPCHGAQQSSPLSSKRQRAACGLPMARNAF
jgi:hypothetical protein